MRKLKLKILKTLRSFVSIMLFGLFTLKIIYMIFNEVLSDNRIYKGITFLIMILVIVMNIINE